MSTTEPPTSEDDVELLLPWYATGRLAPRDAERVRRALDANPELKRRLDLARDEQTETVLSNEALPGPSLKARDDLFARMDATGRAAPVRPKPAAAGWLGSLMAALSPRTLAWSGAAFAALLVVQAGVITGLMVERQSEGFQTASGAAAKTAGTVVLVGFAPAATAADITAFLTSNKAAIVDGPKPGGLYRVRIADQRLPQAEIDAKLAAWRTQTGLVRLALPEPAGN